MYEELFLKGHVVVQEPNILKSIHQHLLNPNIWCLVTEDVERPLKYVDQTLSYHPSYIEVAKKLEEKYVSTYFPQYSFNNIEIWNGVDLEDTRWHNDTGYTDDVNADRPSSLSFLCYFNSFDKSTGGGLSYRHIGNKESVWTVFPKTYDIIIMLHSKLFEHQVHDIPVDTDRIVFHVGFKDNVI